MAESIEQTRVRRALNRLGAFYGLHKSSVVQGLNSTTNTDIKPEEGVFSTNPVETAFLSKGETVPLVSGLLTDEDIEDKKKSNLLVTPYDATASTIGSQVKEVLINEHFKKPAYQGLGSPKGLKDVVPASAIPEKGGSQIHAIQSFSPHVSPATRDADIASIMLNGIPGVEWSRCVPYFEILILNETAAATEKNPVKQTLLRTFLSDVDGDDKNVSTLHNALYDFERNPKDGTPVKNTTDAVAASMDIFCMPQTMVNATDYEQKIAKGYNPFAPLITVTSFTTSASGRMNEGKTTRPGSSPALNHSATITMRVHDKRRLNEVATLVKPGKAGGFGSTRLAITYGWGHPDALDNTRPSDANFSARYGDFLNASRVTEVYSIADSRLSFLPGGEVQVNMDLVVTEQRDSIVSQKLAGNQSITATEFRESVESLIDFVAMNEAAGVNSRGRPNFHVKGFKKQLSKEESLSPDAKAKLKEYFEKIKHIKGNRHGNTGTEGLEQLGELFAATFAEDSQSVFAKAAAASNPSSTIDALITKVCQGHDPFLRPRFANHPSGNSNLDPKKFDKAVKAQVPKTKNAYVSFGKLVIFFLSKTLLSSDVKETQVIFYPFNRNAAGVFDFNIAQFPIESGDLKNKVKAYIKKHGNVQMNDFITFLVDTYIHDDTMQNSWVYGIKGIKTRNSRDTRFNQIYGRTNTKTPPKVEIPKIAIEMTTHKARQKLREGEKEEDISPQKVLRIEIFDQKCTAGPFLTDVTLAEDTGAIQKMQRDTAKEKEAMGAEVAKYTPDHQGLYDKQKKFFEEKGFLSSPGPNVSAMVEELNKGIKKSKDKIKTADFQKMMDEFFYLDNSKKSIKQLLREDFQLLSNGYIIIGAEGTSISDVNVQTQEDSAITNIEMQRRTTEEEKAAQDKAKVNSLPVVTMPTEIDVTCLGNPFIHVSQEYHVDLGTDSSLDGIYAVQSIEHSIEPGKFETKFKLSPQGGGTVYQQPKARLMSFVAGRLK